MTWFDDGVRFKLYVSTDGDFVSLGTRNEYPFIPGGSGIPSGWTWDTDGSASDVNLTTQNGRFSVSNASTTDSHNGKHYRIYRDFPVVVGHRYLIQVQAQQMDGKSPAYRNVTYQVNGTGTSYGSTLTARTPWEQISLRYTPPSGVTFIRMFLMVNPYWSDPTKATMDWGVQYQNFAIVDMLATYPDPTWHEVTCDTAGVTVRYGRAKFTGRYDVATAQISIRNDDGEFTYDPNHEWGLRPGRFLRIAAIHPEFPAVENPFFYGVIDSISDSYGLDGRLLVNISCIDTSSLLSNMTVPTAASESTTFYSGGRFQYLYSVAGWLPQMAANDPGIFIQQTILANGRTVRDELGLIADSEGGWFFTDRKGWLIYRDRTAPTRNPRWSTVIAELLAECPEYVDGTKIIFPQTLGNYLTVNGDGDTQFDVQDIQITARVSFNDIDSTLAQAFVTKGGSTWWFRKTAAARTLQFQIGGIRTSTVPLPYNSNQTFWVRATRDSVANTLTYEHAPDNGTNTLPSSWQQLGDVIGTVGLLGVVPNPLIIGAAGLTGGNWAFGGRLYRLMVRTGSTTLLDIRDDVLAGQAGAPTFTAVTGDVITVNVTSGNNILQVDPDHKGSSLVPVDVIPTSPNPSLVHLQTLATDWSRDRVVNDVQLANQGGSAFQFIDSDSQRRYGPRTYQRLDFLNVNDHPEYLTTRSQDIMDGYTEAMLRVNSVDFKPNEDTYQFAMDLFLNDMTRVRYTHPTNGWGFSVVSHVQSIQHTITTTDWSVQLLLDDAEAFNRWDEAQAGTGWDEAIWDESRWDGAMVAQWSRDSRWSDGVSIWGT